MHAIIPLDCLWHHVKTDTNTRTLKCHYLLSLAAVLESSMWWVWQEVAHCLLRCTCAALKRTRSSVCVYTPCKRLHMVCFFKTGHIVKLQSMTLRYCIARSKDHRMLCWQNECVCVYECVCFIEALSWFTLTLQNNWGTLERVKTESYRHWVFWSVGQAPEMLDPTFPRMQLYSIYLVFF